MLTLTNTAMGIDKLNVLIGGLEFDLLKARIPTLATLSNRESTRIGKTEGGFHRDEDGTAWYVKMHGSPDHAHTEHLTNKIYRALGHAAPHSQLLYDHEKNPIYFSKKVEHFKDFDQGGVSSRSYINNTNIWHEAGAPKEAAHKFISGLAADALTGNHDLHAGNVGLIHGKVPMRVDNGAGIIYNGGGARRDSHTGMRVDHLAGRGEVRNELGTHSIANGTYNIHRHAISHAGMTMSEAVSPRFLKPEVHKIVSLREAHGGWKGFVGRHIPGASPELKEAATRVLEHRTQRLIDHVDGKDIFM